MSKRPNNVAEKVVEVIEQTTVENLPIEQKYTPEVVVEEFKRQGENWSKTFRKFKADGLSTAQIAKVTGKRYQHVRNVLITPVGKEAQPSTPTAE